MGSRGETVVKLRMTAYFWRLLGKYWVILDHMSTHRGCERMSLSGTVTGIVKSHLQRHARWIEEEFDEVRRQGIANQITGLGADFIDAVATASSAQIPHVVRAHKTPGGLTRALIAAGPLRLIGGGPHRPVRRPAEKPRKVRASGGGSTGGADLGAPAPAGSTDRRPGSPGPSDLGLEPQDVLQSAIDLAHDVLGDRAAEDLLRRLREADARERARTGTGDPE